MEQASIEWFIQAIKRLPSEQSVVKGEQGYNNYTTHTSALTGARIQEYIKGRFGL